MKTTKVVLKSLVVLGAVFALVACGSKQESTSTSSSTTETVVLKDGTYKAESGKDDYG
ncbi:hypothetical protein SSUST1_1639 [Streptococcus suis ST1]|nr:hypothetical protein SSUST1_1639 [Streptococcus suis ST1]